MFKEKKAIKRDILAKFRSVSLAGRENLPPFWLELEYLPSLDREERRLCHRAVRELIAQGLCEPSQKHSGNLLLTEKGVNLLRG